eukprot:14208-Eustigmatos_ZCMA.PRE.1
MLVIDEADEMLNRGFKEQIYDIYRCPGGVSGFSVAFIDHPASRLCRYLPPTTQVVLISATLPQEVSTRWSWRAHRLQPAVISSTIALA